MAFISKTLLTKDGSKRIHFFCNAKSKLKTSTETETCRPTQIITQN